MSSFKAISLSQAIILIKESTNLFLMNWKNYTLSCFISIILPLLIIAVCQSAILGYISSEGLDIKNLPTSYGFLGYIFAYMIIFSNIFPYLLLSKIFFILKKEKVLNIKKIQIYIDTIKPTLLLSLIIMVDLVAMIFMIYEITTLLNTNKELYIELAIGFFIWGIITLNFLFLISVVILSGYSFNEGNEFNIRSILNSSSKFLLSSLKFDNVLTLSIILIVLAILSILFLGLVFLTMGLGFVTLFFIVPFIVILFNLFVEKCFNN